MNLTVALISGLGLGLGLETSGLGLEALGLGFEAFGLGLETPGLVNILLSSSKSPTPALFTLDTCNRLQVRLQVTRPGYSYI